MKYESSILKRLIDTYGVVGNPRYLSEIIKEFIVRGKELYPQLFTYQSDWLAHIDEFGLTPEYTVSYTGQHIYAPNTKEKPVKSAILKGQTLVNIATKHHGGYNPAGEVLMKPQLLKANTKYYIKLIDSEFSLRVASFRTNDGLDRLYNATNGIIILTTPPQEEFDNYIYLVFIVSKNGETVEIDNTIRDRFKWIICEYQDGMENWDIPYFEGMQSVKMPVLTTTGKNVFDLTNSGLQAESAYDKSLNIYGFWTFIVQLEPNKEVTVSRKNTNGYNLGVHLKINNENVHTSGYWFVANHAENENKKSITLTTSSDGCIYLLFPSSIERVNKVLDICEYIQIEYGSTATPYEPYKSNILTVNEDVTLRSNGDICDELTLLTGQLTQRIGEDGVVLSKEVIKTVDLTIHDKDHQKVERLTSFEGGTHFTTSSQDGSLLPTLTVDVVTNLEETLKVCSLEGNTV